eukprot:365390-Chlamydomonas_euryale.AAC.8
MVSASFTPICTKVHGRTPIDCRSETAIRSPSAAAATTATTPPATATCKADGTDRQKHRT